MSFAVTSEAVAQFADLTRCAEEAVARRYLARAKNVVQSAVALFQKDAQLNAEQAKAGERLLLACRSGDAQSAELCLNDEPTLVAFRDRSNWTALLHAAKHGHAACVKLLLSSGADVDEPGGTLNETALHWAATLGDEAVATLLLDVGANVNARTLAARTPLHSACASGKVRLVQLLLAREATAAVVDRHQQTPLHHLTYNGEPTLVSLQDQCEIAALLVRAGVNAAHQDVDQKTAHDLAQGEPIKRYLSTLLSAPNAPPPKLQPSDLGSPNAALAAVNSRPVAIAVPLPGASPFVAPLSPAATRKASTTLFADPDAPKPGTRATALVSSPKMTSRADVAALGAPPAREPPLSPRTAVRAAAASPFGAQPQRDAPLSPKAAPRTAASAQRDVPLSPKAAPRAAAAATTLPTRDAPLSPKAAPRATPAATLSSQPQREPPLSPKVAPTRAPATAPVQSGEPVARKVGAAAVDSPPAPARSGSRPLPTPSRNPASARSPSARSDSNAPEPAAEVFSSSALAKPAVVYDAGFARPDVVYEVLLPDHMRVDVQYEESERASPKDVVPRESDNAMELEFSPVSDDASAHAEQAAKAERDARVAAQQAQLELVMKAKRDMEAARQSIFMLEKHRRERSVYQIDEAQRKVIEERAKSPEPAAATLSARSVSPTRSGATPLSARSNSPTRPGALASARSNSPPPALAKQQAVAADVAARNKSPLLATKPAAAGLSQSSTAETSTASPLATRSLALSAGSGEDRAGAASPRLARVPSRAPPPPALPSNVDPFSSIRGPLIIPADVSDMIAEDARLQKEEHLLQEQRKEQQQQQQQQQPLAMCKKCNEAQANTRTLLTATTADYCRTCATAAKQAEMRSPAGRPPCEQCSERPSVAIVTLAGIRGVRDTVSVMCKPCAQHWLSRVPKVVK
jgi:2-phospho-L-lactate guanylyltransferase (CobY/MobA/RfbA family)